MHNQPTHKPVINTSFPSPNFGKRITKVRALVIHCTMIGLNETLQRLTDPQSNVSCHYVIDQTGDIYELVSAQKLFPHITWHAGISRLIIGGEMIERLNHCTVGVELVNLNGNLFPYSDSQYRALSFLIKDLQNYHRELHSPDSLIGHEQIAGFRGKVDPGAMFDWELLYKLVFSNVSNYPLRQAKIAPDILMALNGLKPLLQNEPEISGDLSRLCEKAQDDYLKASAKPSEKEIYEGMIRELNILRASRNKKSACTEDEV